MNINQIILFDHVFNQAPESVNWVWVIGGQISMYLRFFLPIAIAVAFVFGISGIEAQQAFADVIDFETGFVDQQAVGAVVTANNTVTFGVVTTVPCTNPTPRFIAEAGLPLTAFFSK